MIFLLIGGLFILFLSFPLLVLLCFTSHLIYIVVCWSSDHSFDQKSIWFKHSTFILLVKKLADIILVSDWLIIQRKIFFSETTMPIGTKLWNEWCLESPLWKLLIFYWFDKNMTETGILVSDWLIYEKLFTLNETILPVGTKLCRNDV